MGTYKKIVFEMIIRKIIFKAGQIWEDMISLKQLEKRHLLVSNLEKKKRNYLNGYKLEQFYL